jgi:hypothetical protein
MRTCGVHPRAKPETSRFPCKELAHMPGSRTTPERRVLALSHLPMLPSVLSSTSASGLGLSRLNGGPMRSPVNVSPPSSQMSPHDSRASVVRYSFTARNFHSLLFAGFAGAPIMSFRGIIYITPARRLAIAAFLLCLVSRLAICAPYLQPVGDARSLLLMTSVRVAGSLSASGGTLTSGNIQKFRPFNTSNNAIPACDPNGLPEVLNGQNIPRGIGINDPTTRHLR